MLYVPAWPGGTRLKTWPPLQSSNAAPTGPASDTQDPAPTAGVFTTRRPAASTVTSPVRSLRSIIGLSRSRLRSRARSGVGAPGAPRQTLARIGHRGLAAEVDSLARSPFVGLPKKPLLASWFRSTRLPLALNRHTGPCWMPPSQCETGGGVSVSGKSCTTMPHAPWFSTRLFTTVSNIPPDISIPAPTGASPARPNAGTLGLLLSWTKFRWMKVQEPVPLGQRPLCSGGASSLLRELGTIPVLLRSHSESSMRRLPPELVPE